jgi:hypothetical protein
MPHSGEDAEDDGDEREADGDEDQARTVTASAARR